MTMTLIIRRSSGKLAPWEKGEPYDVILRAGNGERKIDAMPRTLASARKRAADYATGRDIAIVEELGEAE